MSSFPQLGQAWPTWTVGGVWYEVLSLDEVDLEEEGYVLLLASGGQLARAVTMQRVRFCTDQRLGVCKLPKSHDPAVMAKENEATKDLKCHAFAAYGTCRFGKNCRQQRVHLETNRIDCNRLILATTITTIYRINTRAGPR